MPTATEVFDIYSRHQNRINQAINRCESGTYAVDSAADKQLGAFRRRINACVRETQKQYEPLQQQLKGLKAQIDQTPQQIINRPTEKAHLEQQLTQSQEHYDRLNAEAPEYLVKAENELSELLDEVVRFEHELRTGEALRRSSKIDFAKREQDFKGAQSYHLQMAWAVLFLMGLLILGTVMLILVLSKPLPDSGSHLWTTYSDPGPMVLSSPPATPAVPKEQWIASLVFLGLGRLALLFFAGWGLKFLAGLHRDHSEQAIMYRDRRAALGVVETMLDAAPDVEQKKKIIETLSTGYLDFDKNAFRRKEAPRTDADFKTVKELVDSVKPLFDSVKGLLEKK